MQTIKINEPYLFNGSQVETITLDALTFSKIIDLSSMATVMAKSTDGASFQGVFRSLRMKAAMKLHTADNKAHTLEYIQISMMPPRIGREVAYAVDFDPAPETIILADGNGFEKPILIKLGSPIGQQNTTAGENADISELEFQVKTFGQLENILSEDNNMRRAAELISHVAKPAGMLQLPTWAVDQISMQDGLFIMNEVMPRFLS